MKILRVIFLLMVIFGICNGREFIRREKRDGNDLFAGLGKILNQLQGSFGGSTSTSTGTNNGNTATNTNTNANANVGPQNPNKQGPVDPNGKAVFCDQNPADCAYLNCLADNFQHSDNSNTLKMGGKILTDKKLRQALQNDPTVSQAACDKIGLSADGCNGFKSFLGLIDKVSPADNTDPRDPNRGKRSPDGLLGTGIGTNTHLNVGGTNANVNSNTNVGVNNGHHNNNNNPTTTTSRPTTRFTSRSWNSGNNGWSTRSWNNGKGGSNSFGGGSGSGSGSGRHGSVDYTDFYDNGGHSGRGSGHGSGSGGNNQQAHVDKDCNAYLPKNSNGGSGGGNTVNGNRGTSNTGRSGNNGNNRGILGNNGNNKNNGNNMDNERGHQ